MSNEVVVCRNQSNVGADTIEIFYTADAGITGVLVTSFTATNDGTSSVSFKAYLYDAGGNPVNSVIPFSIVKRDRANYGPSLVGQIIPPGGSLRIECSAIGGLNFNAAGQVLGT